MADQDKKEDDLKGAPIPERKTPSGEQAVHFGLEKEKAVEDKETARDDKIVSAELRREIEMMELDDKTKKEAEIEREKIDYLGEKEKVEHLLKMARKKGLVFAIHVAKNMNEPYLLDILHDTLAKEGYYKDFTK
jgi:hypothetical protein